MVKVRIDGQETHRTWNEAQALAAAGQAEILQGDGAGTAADTAPAPEPGDLDDMKRAELDALARERGMDPSDYRTKADLIRALR